MGERFEGLRLWPATGQPIRSRIVLRWILPPGTYNTDKFVWRRIRNNTTCGCALIALLLFLGAQCVERVYLRLNQAATADLCSWDCNWYGSIAKDGYDTEPHGHANGDAANWAFFPLFPMTARYVGALNLPSMDMALVVTSKLFFLTAIFSFLLFATAWKQGLNPWIAGLVAAFNPYSIYGNAGYSESLFLTTACLSLYFLKKDRFVASGLVGGLLSGTRIIGGSIGFSLLIRAVGRWRQSRNRDAIVLGLCLVPSGLAAYMLFLHCHMGDALAFSSVQVAWNHAFGNPFLHLQAVFSNTPVSTSAGISIAVAAAAMLWLGKTGRYELLAFTVPATLLPLCTGLGSMPRFIWWQAPVLFAVAAAIGDRRWAAWLYLALSLCCSYMIYAAWFRGSGWVV